MIEVRQAMSAKLYDYRGGSSEVKPTTGISAGSTFFEWDTASIYMFDGTNWHNIDDAEYTVMDGVSF